MTNNSYARAGVDVTAGYETVERIKKHVQRTERQGVMGAIGGFGGLFDLSELKLKQPVLVSGTDGVGTKLKVAIAANKHDSIGIDCVAMCVNDIVAQGAEPLFFLDYIATGKAIPEQLEQIVAGVAEGCVQAGCALVGGETAEMPGMYANNDYDLAGFTVGAAEKTALITSDNVKAGDVLLGLPSSGIHSNGYSLVRKIFFEQKDFELDVILPELGQPLSDVLLTPTKIYVKPILALKEAVAIHGISHVTGGGFVENIPRMLPEGLSANIKLGSWPTLPIFEALQHYGALDSLEVYEIFNMGIGMVVAIAPEDVANAQATLLAAGESSYVIGTVVADDAHHVRLEEV